MRIPLLPSGSSARLLLAFLGAGLAGCSVIPEPAADPTRYYVLAGPDPASGGSDQPAGGLSVGVKPVELSAYLRTRSLVVRDGANEVAFQDYARWAESLDLGLTRVLRAHLAGASAVGRVYVPPFPFDRRRDYDVAVNLLRCEGVREGGRALARLEAVIEITAPADGSVVARQVFVAPDRPWDGRDPAALAAALSESAAALGRAAAAAVAALPAP